MNELHEAVVALEKLKTADLLDEAGAARLVLLILELRELANHVKGPG